MTWHIHIAGHDDLTGTEKEAYEQEVVAKARTLVQDLAAKAGGRVTNAVAVTNTTGEVNLGEVNLLQ